MKLGIENEYLIIDEGGKVRDFTNTDYRALQSIIDKFVPGTEDPQLKKGDLGIKNGYWYLEGDERFDETGKLVDLKIKGLEIRTPICSSIEQVIEVLSDLESKLRKRLSSAGYDIAIAGFNPVVSEYRFAPPLNQWEIYMRAEHREYDAATVSNLTYGPDINLSFDDFTDKDVINAVKKLNYYGPYLAAFSLNAPVVNSTLWGGLSRRTYERNSLRPTARGFVRAAVEPVSPSILTARIPAECGRIEFKSFDMVPDKNYQKGLIALTLGVIRSKELTAVSEEPDGELYKKVATAGFVEPRIREQAQAVLSQARTALQAEFPSYAEFLLPLEAALNTRDTFAARLARQFSDTGKLYWEIDQSNTPG